METLRFIFSSFWIWLGSVIILGVILKVPLLIISRLIRRSMIIKRGWPPAHLDADGDFHKVDTNNGN